MVKEAKPEKIHRDVTRENYSLLITLTEPMLGTVPYNPEVYKKFIESKKPVSTEDSEVETVSQDVLEKAGWTGFHKDEKGLFIYDYMVKGVLKNAADVLKGDMTGQKQMVENYVFVFPRRIHLGVKVPSDILERPLRAMTQQGPRVTVVRSDMVAEGTEIKCSIEVLDSVKVSETKLRSLLDYGFYKGLGQFRNGSYGRFSYILKKGTRVRA